jgi:hypothetical protein
MAEKIAQGRLNKFFKESTLLAQEFIKDNKLSVEQYVKSADKDLTVTGFKRHSLDGADPTTYLSVERWKPRGCSAPLAFFIARSVPFLFRSRIPMMQPRHGTPNHL